MRALALCQRDVEFARTVNGEPAPILRVTRLFSQ
jgi:hypothetical protein